jgi:outer membrane protein TolC
MDTKKINALLLLLLLGSFPLLGQEAFTLQEAIDFGLKNNTEVKNAKIDNEIMVERIWETKAQGLPQISATGQFQNFIDIPTQVLPANAFNPMAPQGELIGLRFGTDYNVNGGIQVNQLLFNGNYIVGLQAIKALNTLNQKLLLKSETDVRFNIAEAYYTCLILMENQKVLDSTLVKTNDLLSSTLILVNEKVMIASNAKQLEFGVLQIQSAISAINSQLEQAKTLLKFQMGYPIDQEIVIKDDFSSAFTTMNQPVASDVSKNINYQLVEQQLALDMLNFKNTKANYLPTVAAFFSHSQNALRNEFDFFDGNQPWYPTTLWGVQLNIPIFSSGQRAAQVSQKALEVKKSENQLIYVSEGIKLQYIQAEQAYVQAQQQVVLQQKSVEVAEAVLRDTEILYKERAVSSIELTQAQSQLLNAQTAYVNALYDLIRASLQIQKLAY